MTLFISSNKNWLPFLFYWLSFIKTNINTRTNHFIIHFSLNHKLTSTEVFKHLTFQQLDIYKKILVGSVGWQQHSPGSLFYSWECLLEEMFQCWFTSGPKSLISAQRKWFGRHLCWMSPHFLLVSILFITYGVSV